MSKKLRLIYQNYNKFKKNLQNLGYIDKNVGWILNKVKWVIGFFFYSTDFSNIEMNLEEYKWMGPKFKK